MTNPLPNPLALTVDTDKLLITQTAPSERILEWKLIAQVAPVSQVRLPLNLALILDRSGSMGGEKLAFVKQAALYVLDQLLPEDRLALVAFDENITLLSPSVAATPDAKLTLRRQINELQVGGYTNLFDGWLKGCEEVAAQTLSKSVNRALLLTDGLANRGTTDIEAITIHVRELRSRGIATSAFGVGEDFEENLLNAMAMHGGGAFYFIDTPKRIPEFFKTELGDLLQVVARECVLSIEIPEGTAIEVLGNISHETSGRVHRIFNGDLVSREERTVYTKVLTPPKTTGDAVEIRATLRYATPDGRSAETHQAIAFRYAVEFDVKSQADKIEVRERSGAVTLAAVATEALKLNKAGKRKEAASLMKQAVQAAPAAPAVQAEYDALSGQLEQEMDELTRKGANAKFYEERKQSKK